MGFGSGNEQCAAWLYLPDGPPKPRPLVIMGHGLGANREMGLDRYARRFAAAGMGVLVFDYRHFGASGGEPRQLLSIARQRDDWRAAIAFARTLKGFDATRIALWGSSFGGGHVLSIAHEDDYLAAVVAQCPFTSGWSSALAKGPISMTKTAVVAVTDMLSADPPQADRGAPGGPEAVGGADECLRRSRGVRPPGRGERTVPAGKYLRALAYRQCSMHRDAIPRASRCRCCTRCATTIR